MVAIFFPLLLLSLTLVDSSYYNTETCGLPLAVRTKRAAAKATDEEASGMREASGAAVLAGTFGSGKEDEESDDDDDDSISRVTTEFEMETDEPDESIKDTLTEKVMGGMNANPGEVPWAVRITGSTGSLCSGTLISNRHVITAAHCFVKGPIVGTCRMDQMMSDTEIIQRTSLIVGASCIPGEGIDCPKESLGIPATVKRVAAFKTPFFQDRCKGSSWDVILLELNEVIPTPHACLPWLHGMDSFDVRKTEMTSFGFGNDPSKGIHINPILQKVYLDTAHDPEICKMVHNLSNNWILCTRETYEKNVCAGDSGGGILAEHTVTRRENGREIREKKKRHFLMGVISFGSSCTASLENSIIADAQVNMDIHLFAGTIDKNLRRLTPDWRLKWMDNKSK